MFANDKKLGHKQRRHEITTYHLPNSDLTVIVTRDEFFVSFPLLAMQNTDTVLFNDSNFIFKTFVFVEISERTLSFTFQLKEKREHFIPVNFLIKYIYATLRRQRGLEHCIFLNCSIFTSILISVLSETLNSFQYVVVKICIEDCYYKNKIIPVLRIICNIY